MTKIIDAFTFFNAVDVLKMRLELHDPYVDHFYICEANLTYSGQPKDYVFEQNMDQFAPWINKITYIKWDATDFAKNLDFSIKDKELNYKFDTPGWLMEFRQRNELTHHICGLDVDDLILITDMDEFVDPTILFALKHYAKEQTWEDARLHMFNHCFYMNCVLPKVEWKHPIACKWSKFRHIDDISTYRHCAGIDMHFPHAGWHFSYLGGIDAVLEKIAASSHTELDTEEINNYEYQLKCMEFGIPPMKDKREFHLKNCEHYFVPLSIYPQALQDIMRKNMRFVRLELS